MVLGVQVLSDCKVSSAVRCNKTEAGAVLQRKHELYQHLSGETCSHKLKIAIGYETIRKKVQ